MSIQEIVVGERAFAPGRVFCIGRNYAAHIAELGNEVPGAPVIFMKPASALVASGSTLEMPSHGDELHHEVELALILGREGRVHDEADARSFIAGLALGLDLTMRDVQRRLKAKGHPWETAKAFDQSAPLGPAVPLEDAHDLAHITFAGAVDGAIRQRGDTALMLFPIPRILVELSRIWTLRPGDVVYTGTPEGVGPLRPGERVEVSGDQLASASWRLKS